MKNQVFISHQTQDLCKNVSQPKLLMNSESEVVLVLLISHDCYILENHDAIE